MDKSRDGIANTLTVAIGVSLVCSILVSTAAVVLRPIQDRNEVLFRQTIVLQVAGLYEPGIDVADRFASIEARLVDPESGEFLGAVADTDTEFESAIGQDVDGRTVFGDLYRIVQRQQ